MKKLTEKPFEYLRTKGDNQPFTEETLRNWYIARAYVLNLFNKEKKYAFGPDSKEHLNVIVVGDTPLMLAVVRQLALSAHFINFVEHDIYGDLVCHNRSEIKLVSRKEASEILGLLEKEECLCNLLQYCKYSVDGTVHNPDSYLDIELEIIKHEPQGKGLFKITEKDVNDFVASQDSETIFKIDTRKAIFASRAYDLGDTINNVPYEGIFMADRYSRALNKFQFRLLEDKKNAEITLVKAEWKTDLSAVKEGLSNLFCSDCFETRSREIEMIEKKDKESLFDVWKRTNQALSLSEHSRWLIEKLIMGYRPLSDEERLKYESCFGAVRKAYGKSLKNNSKDPAHIDVCSYSELRRIDPDNMKYDSFLMLAIPWILDKIEAEDKNENGKD